jgi:hypothetical protein
MRYPVTPDGRYFIVRGRLWRMSDPSLDPARREELKERCRQIAPPAPFILDAHAWAARGRG